VNCVRFSPDGRWMVTGDEASIINVNMTAVYYFLSLNFVVAYYLIEDFVFFSLQVGPPVAGISCLFSVACVIEADVISKELRELLGLEPVSLMIKKSRLRWFGHVEQKDDNDWVKRCITWEVGIRQRGRPKKTVGIVLRMMWKA